MTPVKPEAMKTVVDMLKSYCSQTAHNQNFHVVLIQENSNTQCRLMQWKNIQMGISVLH